MVAPTARLHPQALRHHDVVDDRQAVSPHPQEVHPMRRFATAGLTGILTIALAAAPVTAQEETLDRIELPDGWAPEGITTDGSSLFAGSLADGAIWRADPMSGEGELLAAGAEGRVAAGVDHDGFGRLWAAGGPTGEVRAYDADSGELLATFSLEAGFLNDIAATDEAIYVTDSFMPQVLVIPLGEAGELPDAEAVTALPLSGDLVYGEGFNVNGIVAAPAGLIVVHSGNGQLFRIDPASGASSLIDSGDVSLTGGDGLELDGDTLYLLRNTSNLVVALELDAAAESAALLAEVTSDDFDVPTTMALVGDDLWAVNARFGTEATPETQYWITRVDTVEAADTAAGAEG
jgi:outer membrane protein assembly factor BamB